MATAMVVSTEPTERSIWRMTMTSTMPVAMTAIDEVWTSSVQRLRGVRNWPPSNPSPGLKNRP